MAHEWLVVILLGAKNRRRSSPAMRVFSGRENSRPIAALQTVRWESLDCVSGGRQDGVLREIICCVPDSEHSHRNRVKQRKCNTDLLSLSAQPLEESRAICSSPFVGVGGVMRLLLSAIVVAGSLLAGPLSANPRLAPGKPAGVKQAGATSERREVMLIAGLTLASAALAIILVTDKGSSAPTSTAP